MAARESREGHKKRRPHTPTTGQECGRAQQKEEEKQKNAEKKNAKRTRLVATTQKAPAQPLLKTYNCASLFPIGNYERQNHIL